MDTSPRTRPRSSMRTRGRFVVPPHFATRARAALGARSRERAVGAWGRAAAVVPRARESLHLRVGDRPCTWWAALWAPDGHKATWLRRRFQWSVTPTGKKFGECLAGCANICSTRRMARPEYLEITCKSAVNRVYGMPYLKWSLNPYGGCVHKCRFCFAVQY